MPFVIKNDIIFSSLGRNYFLPKVTRLADNIVAMTLQTIGGSDYFGPVEVTYSEDNGGSWREPEKIPSLGWETMQNGLSEGICDVVPDYHLPSKKILAVGHNAYYKDNCFFDTLGDFNESKKDSDRSLPRYSVYSVCSKGDWSERRRIYWEEFKDCSSVMCGCSQKVILPDGKIIIPFVVGYWGRCDRMACSLLCDFDGEKITPVKRGNMLELPFKRGLLEPSMVQYGKKFFLTLRAEDGHGYLSTSTDGLEWDPIKAWSWEDGSKLTMSTTQQHWLKLGGKLYLVYTRKNGENDMVFRWRAPLFIAEFDLGKLCLKKATEQVVFPMQIHSDNPGSIGRMGNFHTLALSRTEAIVTVGVVHPMVEYAADILLARITT